MTQEQAKFVDEFIYLTSKNTDRARFLAEGFFSANVCIPKGVNRHHSSDVLHQAIEGVKIQGWNNTCYKWEDDASWFIDKNDLDYPTKYRIKPSESAFEYQVAMYFTDGTYEYTKKYFTREEYIEFGFPASCSLKEETKRIRQ